MNAILKDDGYVLVKSDDIRPGDIAAYIVNGDIEHSGLVVESGEQTFGVPRILSKWGRYKELIHLANQCPYDTSNILYYRVKL